MSATEFVPQADPFRMMKLAEKAAIMEALQYTRAEKNLYDFLRAAWPLLEPGRVFVDNWHLRAMADALQAVFEGRITRLIINVPYRTSKSTLISVVFPVWCWVNDPTRRFLTGSHTQTLSTRDALRSRRLMKSEWFQKRWGELFKFNSDQDVKTRYENDQTGYRIAFSMTGGVTGEGGDIIILDDPNNADAMFSQADRDHVNDFFDQQLSTRLNDPAKSAIIVVMQRFHVSDLCGHLLERDGWAHMRLPMGFEPSDPSSIPEIGFEDPRRDEGELLWPARFPQEWVDEQHRTLGVFGIAAQLQQRPNPLEGGMVNLNWFRRYRVLPSIDQWVEVVQAWDTAQKGNELVHAPWVGMTWLRTDVGFFLVRVLRRWMPYPDGKRAVRSEYMWAAQHLSAPNAVVIEEKSTGASLLQELRNDTDLPVLPFEPEKDKITRLGTESPAIEAGNVWLPEDADWLMDFEKEIAAFPNGDTMDQGDVLSMSLKYFRDGGNAPRIRRL